MECFRELFTVGEETELILNSMAIMVFFGLYGYSYCTRDAVESDLDAIDPEALSNKEKNIFKKMATEIETTRNKINDLQDKMSKLLPDMTGKPKEAKEQVKFDDSKTSKAPLDFVPETSKKTANEDGKKVEKTTSEIDKDKKAGGNKHWFK